MEPCKESSVSRASHYTFYRVLSKGALPPGSPHRAPIERDAPFTEPSFISLSKSPCKAAPSMFPQQGPYGETRSVSRAIVSSFIRVSYGPQLRSPPTKRGISCGHRPRSPTWTEDLHGVGCGLVPQGIIYDPSAMQPSARYFPPWLG
jgi:hypothetical protein